MLRISEEKLKDCEEGGRLNGIIVVMGFRSFGDLNCEEVGQGEVEVIWTIHQKSDENIAIE